MDLSNPAVDRDFERALRAVRTISVTTSELRSLTKDDKCLNKLKVKLDEVKSQRMPTQNEITCARNRLKMAHSHLMRVSAAKEVRVAAEEEVLAKIRHRLTFLAEREEVRRVNKIQARIAPRYREPILYG